MSNRRFFLRLSPIRSLNRLRFGIFLPLFILLAMPSVSFGSSGVVSLLKGGVQIKSVKDSSVSVARPGVQVFEGDVITTSADGRVKVLMHDRNEINIGPNSSLKVETYKAGSTLESKNVKLNLIYGSVRSKVEQKYDGQKSKFQIKTLTAVSGVRGTDFRVSFERGVTEVRTFEGEVEFGLIGPNDTILKPVIVGKGTSSSISENSLPSQPETFQPDDQSSDEEEAQNRERPSQSLSTSETSTAAMSVEKKSSNDSKDNNEREQQNLSTADHEQTISQVRPGPFELGYSRISSSSSQGTDSPFLGYSYQLLSDKLPPWLYVAPRFDVQFNRSESNDVNAIYNLGLQGGFAVADGLDLSLEFTYTLSSEDGVTKSFTNTGFWISKRVQAISISWLKPVSRFFIGYRALNTPIPSNLFVVGLGFGFE